MKNENENNEEVDNNGDESGKPLSEYVKELLKEKVSLDPDQHPNAMRLLDEEVVNAQSLTGGKPAKPEVRYLDLMKEKPIKVSAKVLVPVKEHPKFNFVGKLLGPKGNSLKRLQEETMTRMAILGRGSMRDKAKEEELRNGLDPKYSHLCDELHVEIHAYAPPAEAYARLAYALAEIRKYLIPDVGDDVRQDQLREFQQYSSGPNSRPSRVSAPIPGGGPLPRGGRGGALGRPGGPRAPLMGPGGRGVPPPSLGGPGVPPHRPTAGKAKVMSILDKARVALDESYGPPNYDDGGYYDGPAPMPYGSAYNGSGFYDGSGYGGGGPENMSGGGWKAYGNAPSKRENMGGGKALSGMGSRYGNSRSTPYNRPPK